MVIDVIALVLILIGFVTGYRRGLINTVFDTLSILIAVVASLKLSPIMMDFVEGTFKLGSGLSFIIGFVATFFIVMMIIRFVGNRLEGLLKAIKINFVNKIAGGVVMGGVFAVLFSFLLYLVSSMSLMDDSSKQTSITYPMLSKLPDQSKALFNGLKPVFSEFWEKTVDTIDTIKEKTDDIQSDGKKIG